MKVQMTLAASGLFAAAWIGLSTQTEGFTTIGGSLGPLQRDVRVFNNFTDSTANNNTNPHPSFPGYLGADLAIWKACVEWGSRAHGDGSGDPTQTDGVGNGGGNFDPSFQGNANGVGGTNDNIHSELSGSNGGVLAYCETPIGNGWRIRYYSGWTWHDGPGQNIPGIDLQGVACHEFGHALGLGHSMVGGATMWPSVSGSGVAQRSISADDSAGVQFIYGVIDSGKPEITSIGVINGQLTILGNNFDGSDNEVWFTQAASGGDGTPVKVFSIPSTAGGTRIELTVPGAAGPGDVLVRNQNGGHASISNAFPYSDSACPDPVVYCSTSPHSEGTGATINVVGSPSISANDFTLETNEAPVNKSGLFFYGPTQIQVSFGDGLRCVGGATKRLPVLQTDFVGYAAFTLDLSTAVNVAPGTTQNFQFWFRDPMGPGGNGFNLSNAVSVFFCD